MILVTFNVFIFLTFKFDKLIENLEIICVWNYSLTMFLYIYTNVSVQKQRCLFIYYTFFKDYSRKEIKKKKKEKRWKMLESQYNK